MKSGVMNFISPSLLVLKALFKLRSLSSRLETDRGHTMTSSHVSICSISSATSEYGILLSFPYFSVSFEYILST